MTEGLFGKAHFEYLSLSGCFDTICPNRKKVFFSADVLANCANSSSLDLQTKQENIFSKNTKLSEIWKLSSVEEWTEKEKLEKERLSLGFYFSGHPTDKYKNILKILSMK